MTSDRVLNAITLIAAGLALVVSLDTALSLPRRRAVIQRKQDTLQQIQTHASRWSAEEALQARLDAAGAWTPMDLNALATRLWNSEAIRTYMRQAVPIADGWQVREAVLEGRGIPYATLPAFLDEASRHEPAWRLRALELKSAAAGEGDATLTMEALEKIQR